MATKARQCRRLQRFRKLRDAVARERWRGTRRAKLMLMMTQQQKRQHGQHTIDDEEVDARYEYEAKKLVYLCRDLNGAPNFLPLEWNLHHMTSYA